ncbi:MAG: ATP-binding protein [Comamonadaceae bacterium]
MFDRILKQAILDQLNQAPGQAGAAVILYGPRQAGKTTLVRSLLADTPDALALTGDDLYIQTLLARHELDHLKRVVGKAPIVFIDEAQRIANIGLTMKLLVDHLPVKVIASGSASFELADRLAEPLTGRARTFHLHPLSWPELAPKYRLTSPETAMQDMLRFGMYPRIHMLESDREREEYAYDYINHYLYRDLLEFEQIKKPKKVVDLLILLAHQIGREVAVSELASSLALSQRTVESYLDILEKMFVLVNIRGFARNLRKEVTKTSRYYFCDIGLRNALIRNFTPLALRGDVGELFENWFVMERIKRADNARQPTLFYFWRTYDQKEIDLIEDRDGKLNAFECKWSPSTRSKAPADWTTAYPQASYTVATRENWQALLASEG